MAIPNRVVPPFTAYRLTPSFRVQRIETLDRHPGRWKDYYDPKGRGYWARDLFLTADEAYDAGTEALIAAQTRIDKAQERINKRTTNLGQPVQVRK